MSTRWTLHHGDCLAWLRTIESESVDAVVTDPPAGIGFMNREWDHHKGGRAEWVAWLAEVMRECLRVLKPGGHALVWSLPRTEHWTACAVEDAGFEIRDGVYHLCAQGWPKSLDVSKAIDAAAGESGSFGAPKSAAHAGWISRGAMRAGDGHEGYQRPWMQDGAAVDRAARQYLPSTNDAKRWQGWGTATKPAVEKWILGRKKTSLEDEIRKASECVTRLIASTVESESLSNEAASVPEGRQDSAPQRAEPPSATRVASSEATDMSLSESATASNSNIALSWLQCLEELSRLASTFTTETESRLTTDLRTLNSYLSQITRDDTLALKTNRSSLSSHAQAAALLFDVVRIECVAIQARFAAASAGVSTEHLESQSRLPLLARETLRVVSSFERWVLARKPLAGTVAANVLAHGVGALNIDGCRVACDARPALSHDGEKQQYGSYSTRTGSRAVGETTLGRWPANVVLSHAETCGDECDPACPVAALDAQTSTLRGDVPAQSQRTRRGSQRTTYSPIGVSPMSKPYADEGGASRFFPVFHPFGYFGKAKSKSQRGGENRHPTVKHIDLMRWLVRLVTPRGGLVLDAFGGSGTTGVAALLEGMRFAGAEADAESYATACRRLAAAEIGETVARTAEPAPKPAERHDAQPSLFGKDGAR